MFSDKRFKDKKMSLKNLIGMILSISAMVLIIYFYDLKLGLFLVMLLLGNKLELSKD